jgi:hypothetical protein
MQSERLYSDNARQSRFPSGTLRMPCARSAAEQPTPRHHKFFRGEVFALEDGTFVVFFDLPTALDSTSLLACSRRRRIAELFVMPQPLPTERVEIEGGARPRIFRGVVFGCLAVGQLCFAFVFAYRFYIVSQSGWATIDSRWIFPVIALASCVAFAREAWRSFAAKKGT